MGRGEQKMAIKRSGWATIAIVIAAGLGCVAGGRREEVFKGEIADSQCALNVHSLSRSHAEMLAKGKMGTTAGDCARYCVKNLGGVFVLEMKEKVYKLDNQVLAEKNAGEQVKVIGILDSQSNTIAVHSMEKLN
jgi:hypothetical protein